jgi:hypothetical protein
MRYSCDKDDAGYKAWCDLASDGRKVLVYLDRALLKDAITADDVEGIVIHPRRTAEGNISINPHSGEILLETLRGKVTFEVV